MAEGRAADIEEKVCPINLYSSSQNGARSKCSNNSTCRSEPGDICSFFLKGNCKFGDECWFLHSTIKEDINLNELRKNEQIVESNNQQIDNCSSQLTHRGVRIKNNVQNFSSMRSVEQPTSYAPNTSNWVLAPEFVPKKNISYSDALKLNNYAILSEPQKNNMECCYHFYVGECPIYDCPCMHGIQCDICQKWCLDPSNEMQRKRHIEECTKEFEQNMEYSFALQNSQEKTCGICMDVIMQKTPISERKFGILENCNHVFCLSCIRKWRSTESFKIAEDVEQELDLNATRSCPECRVSSHFITPSKYLVETESEKKKLISEYKLDLSKRPCKHFGQGEGKCPFGGACFYLHALPDGTKVVLPLPTSRRRRQNQDGELDYDYEDRFQLRDFLELRDRVV